MSGEVDKYREAIKKGRKLDSLESAMEVLDAYHKLEELGSNELEELRFEYVRAGLDNAFLEKAFEYHLVDCFDCLQKTTNLKHFITATDLYGDSVITKVESEELKEKAAEHREIGNYEEAIKCLEEALKLRPGDERIENMIKEMGGKGDKVSFIAPLMERLKALIHEASMVCRIIDNTQQTKAPVLGALEVDESKKYVFKIGEPITICVEIPLEKDGYLTVFHYDNEANLEIIFPTEETKASFFKGGAQTVMTIKAKKPLGKHYLKSIWTSKQLLAPDKICFEDISSMSEVIEDFIESIRNLPYEEWMDSVGFFEVVEN